MKGIFEHFWDGKAGTAPKLERQPNEKINFIGGFDGYTVGNLREIKRIFNLMGVEYTILGDNSDVWDTPDRRRVPHVRRRHHAGRGRQRGPRQGHHIDAGILHREDPAA